ncbi:MAG: aminotransferase class V-fold PLP-dependent enzyme [Deltaproteobacteria bacterium]|nr:aminotransferase class V-fold PLP-dependent enzyme [Deltaproteobacteria bacterium]
MSPLALLAELCAPFADGALVHLNNAGVAPMSARSEKAMIDLAALMREGSHGVPRLLQRYEAARETVGRLVGCEAADVAFFQTCASAISQVAFGFPLGKGDNIVLLDQEYPSNYYPWHRAAERAGADVVVVPSGPDFTVDHDALIAAITSKTAVVAVSFVQFSTGAIVDLPRVVEAAHKAGAIVVVDAIQGLGMVPFSMADLGVDAVCGGSHKWLLGPLGHGFLALSPALRAHLTPILQGAISYGTPDDVVDPVRPLRSDIRRFEPGAPHALGAVPLAASIELLLGIGVELLNKEANAISDHVVDEALRRGFTVRPRSKSPIVVFVPPGDLKEHAMRLREEGISLAVRGGGLRVSPHAFNSRDDVARLFSALGV